MEESYTLGFHREFVDRVDVNIARLLQVRAEHVLAIARLKKEAGIATHQPEREAEVLRNVLAVGKEGLWGPEPIEEVFQTILKLSRRSQEETNG